MNFFLVLCVVLATVCLSSGAELRKARSFNLSQKKGLKLQNMASTATFPASPMYAVVEQYSDAACTTVTQGNSYILDTCLANSATSNLYTCASGTGTLTTYSDTTCTTASGAPDSFTVGDCVAAGGGYMKIVACGSDSTAYSTELITNKIYQLAGCSQNLGSDAFPNDSCIDMSNGVDVYSIQINWPKVKVYGTTDCSGVVLDSSSISTSCAPPGTDDDSELDYNTYSKVSYGSGAFSNLSFGFGALISALMVALQLMKN